MPFIECNTLKTIGLKKGDKMLLKKATSSGANAAIIIGVIGIALILYIIFLPEAERQKILKEGGIEYEEGLPGDFLLRKHVGRLVHQSQDSISHYVPSFHLFESRESEVLHKYNPFIIRRSWFSRKFQTLRFSFDNFENTDNVLLAFDAPKHEGILRIRLNSQLIYEFSVKTALVKPVPLDKVLLKPKDNILEFEVGGTGLRFWDANVYSIDGLRIIGDITDVSRQASSNTLVVDAAEMDNIVSAKLSFLPRCDEAEVGNLNIKINSELIYSAIPDCGSIAIQDVDKDLLNEGRNVVFFQTKKGDYRLDSIKLISKLKTVKSFIEYFEVDEDLYEDIADESSSIVLYVDFVDNNEAKRGSINVNGHMASFDQKTPLFKRDISKWVKEGARNYIEIIPETTLEIPEVRVKVE